MTLKSKFNNWRWKRTKSNYIFDKLIFNIAFFLIMAFLFSIVWSYNFDFSLQIYYKCNQETPCKNPFYDAIISTSNPLYDVDEICTYDWCYEEYLPGGFEFGKKPSPLFKWAWPVTLILSILVVVINHIIHNKGWPEVEG